MEFQKQPLINDDRIRERARVRARQAVEAGLIDPCEEIRLYEFHLWDIRNSQRLRKMCRK